MSEHKQEKWLHTFTISKETEEEKQVEETVNGEVVKVTRKVKTLKDVVFALKKPNRRLYERADLFYGVQLAAGIRAGLLTKALLLKRYRDDGGALSEGDTQYFNNLVEQLSVVELEHQRALANLDKLSVSDNEKRIKEAFDKKFDIVRKLQSFETINRALFSHTAESKAEMQLSNWWTVYLGYWDENGDGNYTEFFKGDNFEDKMKYWDELYDKDEAFFLEALARFSLIIGLWSNGANTPDDFKSSEVQQAKPEVQQATVPEVAVTEVDKPVTSNAA